VSSQIQQILEQGQWFSGCSTELKAFLLSGRQRQLEAGEVLFHRGDVNDGLYAVLSGSLKIHGYSEEGRESILTYIEVPNWFGELALFDRSIRTHDAVAAVSTTVLHLPLSSLDDFLKKHPECWREIGVLLSQKLRLSFALIEDMSLLPAPKRLAKRLFLMATRYGEGDATIVSRATNIQLAVSQEDLGRMLAISRQTVNQILKELAAAGLISIDYGKLQILDISALEDYFS
jgi:CRP/FNR family cyclic AMP-dependent transcriptional regulator